MLALACLNHRFWLHWPVEWRGHPDFLPNAILTSSPSWESRTQVRSFLNFSVHEGHLGRLQRFPLNRAGWSPRMYISIKLPENLTLLVRGSHFETLSSKGLGGEGLRRTNAWARGWMRGLARQSPGGVWPEKDRDLFSISVNFFECFWEMWGGNVIPF